MIDKTLTVKKLLKERILVLDGAMGTMLQAQGLSDKDFNAGEFANHPKSLKGDNDVLCITRPDAVAAVHRAYLEAGADIIETNTFNANRFSQLDYGLEDRVYDLAKAGASVARSAADEAMRKTPGRIRLVAGSIGPTGRTASISPSVDDPAARNVTFDGLAKTFQTAAEGLIDGGADILLIETAFDTLNVKAAIYGIEDAMRTRDIRIPLMISATLSDASGRMLAGQSVEAFLNSVLHAECLLSIGFNCALGADEMRPHLAELSAKTPTFVSAHPNAGLPDEFGKYLQTPEMMAKAIRDFAGKGCVNIVGGCCGTTPEHIAEIARTVRGIAPRIPPIIEPCLRLSGLDPFNADSTKNFINIGERTNVAGSRKFLNLIKANDMPSAMTVARHQIENGALVIDVNMDDAMLDSVSAMNSFLNYAASEPDIARVPIMLDSSNWNVIREGLRRIQGRSIVNSISLKEGEKLFLEKAREIRRLGAAVLVMAFDERGQADTLERRVEVCSRAYGLLTEKAQFSPEDIVFDPNVFAIATGMKEHDNYAVDFIESVRILKKKYPLCGFSGGISNVSFSFRGNDAVRGAIHTVFLKHAIEAGLTMGIVNAAQLGIYEDLDPVLREAAEAVVLNKSPDAAEKLLSIASGIKTEKQEHTPSAADAWRNAPLEERIARSLVKGDDTFAESDMAEALAAYPAPMKIVEGPLMDGMKRVGELFSSGRMFLPQVVKSARVMKRSVASLMPALEQTQGKNASARTIVLATVKGDVHDIGKNIVSVVLQCNNCRVIDLGVMVPAKEIADAAGKNRADIVGLSGLITPSLAEIGHVIEELRSRGLAIPVMVGGAAVSKNYTALKLQGDYPAPVVYTTDASAAVPVAAALTDPEKKAVFASKLAEEYAELRTAHEKNSLKKKLSPDEARVKSRRFECENPVPHDTKIHVFTLKPADVEACIDWEGLARSWKTPSSACCAHELISDAKKLMREIPLSIHCVCGVFPAAPGKEDSIEILSASREKVLYSIRTPRQTEPDSRFLSLCDFISAKNPDWIGAFAAGVFGADSAAEEFSAKNDDYSAILVKTLANRLAEAAAEYTHMRIRREFWGYEQGSVAASLDLIKGNYRGIRPAPGYPMIPDHAVKKELFALLEAEKNTGIKLTESYMMMPEAAVCAFCIANPDASAFTVR